MTETTKGARLGVALRAWQDTELSAPFFLQPSTSIARTASRIA